MRSAIPRSSPGGILIVDDHDLVRLGVRALLQAQESPSGEGVEIFEADCLAQALTIYERFASSIGLVLLDLALPDTQGLSAVSQFHERHPDARIVALSGAGTTSLAQSAMAQGALTLGASAFLPKSANLKEVVSFIRACGLLGSDVVDGLAGAAPPSARTTRYSRPSYSRAWRSLTASQVRVLQLVLEGRTNKEIAQLADLQEGTVKNYVSTILLLFGMRSRAQLISSLR